MKLTIDSVILALSLATIGFLGYMIVSTTLLYRDEYKRGCNNGIASLCDRPGSLGDMCFEARVKAAFDQCMLHNNQ